MPTIIRAGDDTIRIDRAFVSGKDRVKLNGQTVFEQRLGNKTPQQFSVGERVYVIEKEIVSKLSNAWIVHLQILERGELAHDAIYDQTGKEVSNTASAKSSAGIHLCSVIGGVIGIVALVAGNRAAGFLPLDGALGGAVLGGLGGGLGAMLGHGVGLLIFGRGEGEEEQN